jgi:hypothetical protein
MDFLGPKATLSVRVDGFAYVIEQALQTIKRRFLHSVVIVFELNLMRF